jgi:hypothetical protein
MFVTAKFSLFSGSYGQVIDEARSFEPLVLIVDMLASSSSQQEPVY